MSKIVLDDLPSGFNRGRIDSNFTKIEQEFQDKVLYRDNPTGEPNQMENDLDMNSNDLLNTGRVSAASLTLAGVDLTPTSTFLEGRYDQTFSTLSDLVASTSVSLGEVVRVLGYHSLGDGGGNFYEIVPASTGTVDGGSYIDLTGISGQAKGLFVDGRVSVKQFGAKGDGVDEDLDYIQAALDYHPTIFIPEGTYLIGDPGVFHVDNMTLIGEGKTKTILKKMPSNGSTNLDPVVRERFVDSLATPVYNAVIEGIGFVGNGDPAIKTPKAAGLLRFYEHYGLRVVNCSFSKGRGYGAGFEGSAGSGTPTRRGPHRDSYFEDCDFYENGKADYLTGTDYDDGVDFKASDRATFVGCKAWDNGDKGFDLRARDGIFIGCQSWDNAGSGFASQIEGVQSGTTTIEPGSVTFLSCIARDNTGNGFSVVPQVTPGVVGGEQYTNFFACTAYNNTHNFNVSSQGTNDLAVSYVALTSCISRNPTAGTRHFLASGPLEGLTISGGIFDGGTTTGLTVNSAQIGSTTITGALIQNISGNAITGSTDNNSYLTVTGNTFRNVTSQAVSAHSNCTVVGNSYENIGSSTPVNFTGTNNKVLDYSVGGRTVASASTITIPDISNLITLSGGTTVTSVTASYAQRQVVLRASTNITIQDGGNLLLAGDFVANSNDTLTIMCDGTNWVELSRSVN